MYRHWSSVERVPVGEMPVGPLRAQPGRTLILVTVAAIRKDRNLPPLDVYVIDVISSSTDSLIPITVGADGSANGNAASTSLVGETDQRRLKEGKMSSSYIRKWLAEGGEAGGIA